MHWDYILILVILAIVVPWRSSSRVRALLDGPELASSERILLYLSTIWFQWIAVIVIAWRCAAHHLGASDLGIAIPHAVRAISVAFVLSVVLVLNQVFSVRRISSMPQERRGFVARLAEKLLPRTTVEILIGIVLVLTVALCEEFIYRGFVQAIFSDLFSGSVVAGALISAIFFGSAHVYQGKRGVITTFAVGLIFSVARAWTGSLLPSMIIHFAVDLSAGIVAAKCLPITGSPKAIITLFFNTIPTNGHRAPRRGNA